VTFEKQDIHDVLDPRKFVESLELDQVGFLAMYLKGSQNKKYYPLRVALEERLRNTPIQRGVGTLVARRFYKSHNNGDTP
jgi:hypothetical protein